VLTYDGFYTRLHRHGAEIFFHKPCIAYTTGALTVQVNFKVDYLMHCVVDWLETIQQSLNSSSCPRKSLLDFSMRPTVYLFIINTIVIHLYCQIISTYTFCDLCRLMRLLIWSIIFIMVCVCYKICNIYVVCWCNGTRVESLFRILASVSKWWGPWGLSWTPRTNNRGLGFASTHWL